MEIYQKRQLLFNTQYNAIRGKYKLVGAIRLLVFLAVIYFFYLALANADTFYLYIVGGAVIAFLILLRIHVGYSWRMRYVQALKDINKDELSFLEKKNYSR